MLKIRIEMSEGVQEEVVIRCREITPEIIRLQQLLSGNSDRSNQFLVYKGDTEYYLNVNDIIFLKQRGTLLWRIQGMMCMKPGASFTSCKNF